MKEFLMILGGLFLLIIVTFVSIAAIFLPRFLKSSKEVLVYINDIFPKIFNNWDYLEIQNNVAPHPPIESSDKASKELEELFNYCLIHLGKLKSYREPKLAGEATESS